MFDGLKELPEARGRIGLIVPSSNRLTEPQMRRYAPAGVDVHVTRLRMTGASHVPLPELVPRVVEATQALDDARCDVIVFHCTAASMEDGLAGERLVLDSMRSVTDASVATTASASVAAMGALDLRRIALFSPYVASTHDHERVFLEEAGIRVVSGRCLGLSGSDEYVSVTPAEWLHLAEIETPTDADGVFLSCTNTHSPQIIQSLEAQLGRPVVTSNQAVLWHALRLCGLEDVVEGLGRLFELRGVVTREWEGQVAWR